MERIKLKIGDDNDEVILMANLTAMPGLFTVPFTIFTIMCGIVVLTIIVLVLLIVLLKDEVFSTTKKCPYCMKRIPKDAVWCKHCKRDLS
ncbi:MAG: hypothetical protein ACOC89_02915 [Candidatus Saliniplasma sp.]